MCVGLAKPAACPGLDSGSIWFGLDFSFVSFLCIKTKKRKGVGVMGHFSHWPYCKVCTATGSISVKTLFSPAMAQINE